MNSEAVVKTLDRTFAVIALGSLLGLALHVAPAVAGGARTSGDSGKAGTPPSERSASEARQEVGATARIQPHSGSGFVYSQTADDSYKRLSTRVPVPTGGGSLSFWVDYDTEADRDYLFVEAHRPGSEDWTTLPELNGHTSTATGESCASGWQTLHPQLAHYQTWDGDAACTPTGTTGAWNAASGGSGGWEQWQVDLSPYADGDVEIAIAYASDAEVQGTGVFIDDATLPDGTTTSFEKGLDGWEIAPPPPGTARNYTDFTRTHAASCVPQSYSLTGLTGPDSHVNALSDSGWAVGVSEGAAVAWRDPTHIIDTGVGDTTRKDGTKVHGDAVDVNEAGVAAINRTAYRKGHLVSARVVLWSASDGRTMLPTAKLRPRSEVSSINDHGVAVGSIRGRGHPQVPVMWRHGSLVRLPVPAGANGAAVDNNNHGLIVGNVWKGQRDLPWAWRAGGAGGPLKAFKRYVYVKTVDDSGRITGSVDNYESASGTVMWRHRTLEPRVLFPSTVVSDMHDNGYLTASYIDGRGYPGPTSVGRLRHGGVLATLPGPGRPGGWWAVTALSVAHGVSGFAPQGGLSVVGYGEVENGDRGVVWTCTQKYLPAP